MLPPSPVTRVSPDTDWKMIYDSQDCFTPSEEEEIKDQLRTYYDKTGIETVIKTISEEDFEEADKDSLETYAYWDYVNTWDDEDHWLIVFKVEGDSGRWAFEGMQGDNTDEQLDQVLSYEFNDQLTRYLWQNSKYTYGEAFIEAFKWLNDNSGKPDFDYERIIMLIVSAGLGALFVFTAKYDVDKRMARKGYKEIKYKPDMVGGQPKLVTCEYCGGTYVFGELKCPYCGAPGKTGNQDQ